MQHRQPGEGKYARVEREQRWRALRVAEGAARGSEILDRYIIGTTLRLRRMWSGDEVVFKLGQKVRPMDERPEIVKVTNIYLSVDEYTLLAGLAAMELRKTRWHTDWCDHVLAIDEFHGRHAGLVLAEVELAAGEARCPAPPHAVKDVTDDDRFSGGAIAAASDSDLAALLEC